MASLNRKALTLDCKVEIIKAVESGRKKADVCRDFGLANSTVCTIIKNREKILKSFQDGKGQVKKIKLCEKVNIDDALIKWFNQCRSSNLPLNGLMEKAEEFGRLLGDTNFKCSNGWLDRFKQRHNISFGKVCGEAKSVNLLDVENWLRDVWPKLRGEYADEDIYNADETGIFYKLLPDKTFKFKKEKCVVGKLAKDRITAFVCANMTGTDKRKLLVIGKSKNPRCFKNIKTLPVNYKANKKSWMTSEIFEEEIRKWDKELIGK
ncbi:tigger transposable element-derived protein 4-like [Centruroides sculpturatus]|uniref:tigger transposable element-derived protein 4-like n=1 Tax=Centruroides sculpturatus TaxID=218467 RepID=UPI000C6E3BB8|nr:tigger transposable element-derived protein 4-like [Centruroides sculpturatus]